MTTPTGNQITIPGATGITVSSTNTIYCVGFNSPTVYSLSTDLSTKTPVVTFPGNNLHGIVCYNDASGIQLYITSHNNSSLIIYNVYDDTSNTIALGGNPTGLRIQSGIVYISLYNIGNICTYNISTESINNNYITGLNNPQGIAFDTTGYMYVSEYGSNRVSKFIGATQQLFSLTVSCPTGIAYNSGYLFISSNANNTGENVYQYDTNGNFITTFATTSSPYGLLFANDLFFVASYGSNMVYSYTYSITCYDKHTKILCLQNNIEEYITISDLKIGDLVKTYKNGYKKIELIDCRNIIQNTKKNSRMYQYKYSIDNFENLKVTGGHSILVDELSENEKNSQLSINFNERIEDKQLALAMYSSQFEEIPFQNEINTVYHLVLENEDENGHYGMWASGILTESCIKKYFNKYLC